ncbi:hypothetical protein [Streptomyces sp. NPDC056160]|uniref:hypothetical protein n=1 Tax=Streptomyces sp. NPDC056160 TaxID=3345731 RepID=UPI0035D829DA
MARTLRLAVAQSTVPEDPTDRGALRAAGQEIRALMAEAAEAGARLVQFPEGAIVYPSKHVMAANPDGELGHVSSRDQSAGCAFVARSGPVDRRT